MNNLKNYIKCTIRAATTANDIIAQLTIINSLLSAITNSAYKATVSESVRNEKDFQIKTITSFM